MMKKLPAVILFVMYTLLVVLATSEIIMYENSLGSTMHFPVYIMTALAIALTGVAYLTYRFGMRLLTWGLLIVGLLVGIYVATVHINKMKVLNNDVMEINLQMHELQQKNDPKLDSSK